MTVLTQKTVIKKYDATERQAQRAICVKCGFNGWVSEPFPASTDAKPRWRKFKALVTCPSCGDDRGHCGILSAPLETSLEVEIAETFYAPSSFTLRHAHASVCEIINALNGKDAAEALQVIRGYDPQLAFWLANRGIRFGSIADIRFQVSATTLAHLPSPHLLSPDEPCFWLPVVNYPNGHEPTFTALQVRRLQGEPRYLTVKFANTPLVHMALPTEDRTDGKRFSAVWCTEGILKAEVAAYRLGVVAVGALGTGALKQAISIAGQAARQWHKEANLFTAPIVLAPDADARAKLSVAKSWWQVAKYLQSEGFSVSFAVWSPCYKGVDDALLAGEMPQVVAPEVWLATLQSRIRNELLQVKVRPRLLLDRETAQAFDLPESVAPQQSIIGQTYEVAKRKEAWLQALSCPTDNGKAVVVVDASPTGSGKTYTAASLRLSEVRRVGLFAKRLVYISAEVKRASVKPLERFRLFQGRDALCSFWERLQVVETEGLTKVGKRICAYCPVKNQCAYYAQKKSGGRRYWRVSWQSYSPKEGDFLVLDEFSRLPLWRDFSITEDQLKAFLTLLDRYGAPAPILAAFRTLQETMSQNKDLTHEEVARIFSAVALDQWNAFAHDILTLFSDIRKVRSWIFKETDQRPVWLGWAQAIADIFRCHLVGQVWVEAGMLKVKVLDSKLRDAVRKASAVLVLDATADPAEIERLLGTKVTVVRSDEPERLPKVLQVPLGALSHRASTTSQHRWLWTAKQVVESMRRRGLLPAQAKVGVLTHKSAAEIAKRVFGEQTVVGWWGRDERATNAYFEAGVQVLVCVGLPHRNISAIAAERLKAGTRQRAFRKAKLDPQGHWWTILREFADPELAAAVRQEAAVAYLQAAGRLRQSRRSERCYLIVLDAEPLPEALNPVVLPPDQILPPELWQDWERRRQRGAAIINSLRQKAAAERLARAAEAIRLYKAAVGEDPKPAWLARILRVHRKHAVRLLRQVTQTGAYISENREDNETTDVGTQMYAPICVTLEDAIRAFITAGYPLPVRALARRFGVCDAKVRRLARRLAKAQPAEPISTDAPANTHADEPSQTPTGETHNQALFCPRCGEPLDTDDGEVIGCVGCGAGWRITEQGLALSDDGSPTDEHDQTDRDQIDQDKVVVVCLRCGSRRSVSVDAFMLTEPHCFICGEVMRPEPQGDPSTPLVQSESSDRFVDTEEWINAWWWEVNHSAPPPAQVLSELDGEIIPPEKLFLSRMAICSRCGHREAVDAKVLLPPLCPACGATMDWVASAAV